MAEMLIQGSGINKSFGTHGARRQVLFDVGVTVRAGECLAIIGGSGSGKTTLTRILLGLETADSGVVEYRGRNIAEGRQGLLASLIPRHSKAPSVPPHSEEPSVPPLSEQRSFSRHSKPSSLPCHSEQCSVPCRSKEPPVPCHSEAPSVPCHSERSRGIFPAKPRQGLQLLREESGLVFQDPFSSLDPRWRVGPSVAEPLKLRHKQLSSAAIEQRVAEVLGLVGLDAATLSNRYPIDLSGGQAQRVAIARAIVANPKVVLADEALSAIDTAVRVQILDAFATIRRADRDMALIMVSHDLGVVRHIADRILVLHEGRVEESGPTARLLAHPQSAYTRRLIEAASL